MKSFGVSHEDAQDKDGWRGKLANLEKWALKDEMHLCV